MAAYAVYDYKIGLPNNALSNVKILSHVDGDKIDTFDSLNSFDQHPEVSASDDHASFKGYSYDYGYDYSNDY